ncbi:MAG: PilC/PilY family type IV pilus protein, partial [Gammaproteobacteria bacterium]|nr:PilC/PilY family type IV pilus protein [Gammaproteobacteria bacterium]
MNTRNRKLTSFGSSLLTSMLAAFVALHSVATQAAPGVISTSPLFLKNAVQPNIALMIDDSGSMGWEQILNKGTADPGDVAYTGALYHPPGSYTAANGADAARDREDRRLTCSGFNVMAYDPTVQYTPWIGNDSAGNAYADLTLTTARDNPYNTATTNISTHVYFIWTDSDNDGEYDGPVPAVGDSAGTAPASADDECGNVANNSGGVAVTSLPLTGTAINPNSQQNYANWYSYYRKREYVAKRALSQVISESTSRVGMSTINATVKNFSPVEVQDIDDISLPVDPTAAANKSALLTRLFQISSSGGTPLRQALQAVGDYFDMSINSDWGNSPILPAANGGECQKNFSLLMSDGFWRGDPPSPSVGNADTDNDTIFDGGSFADGAADVEDTLADVAMHYYENDLATTLRDRVPVTVGVDPSGLADDLMHQHMKTFTVVFGVEGTLTSNPPDQVTPFAWPTPVPNELTTIDDMRHAAWNGRGSFLNAGNPGQLISSINTSIGNINAQVSSGAAVALNTSTLSTNSQVYLARFTSGRWTGNLVSYALDAITGAINNTPTWEAGTLLTARDLSTNPRTILTYNGTDGVAFQWANLTTAQRNDLRTNPSGGTDNDATALARLAYLRGLRSCENGDPGICNHTDGTNTYTSKGLRARASRLGDIIHSAPVYVGIPEVNWPDTLPGATVAYSDFRLAQSNRAGIVYLGANDGMLHGFRESDGREVLAYMPQSLFSTTVNEGLHYLTDPAYGHRYYVDLRPSVTDVFARTTVAGTAAWRSVLVGGLRGGGRGLFALDITDPTAYAETSTAAADTVMWEFSSADDADLGHTFSQPAIVLMPNGKWAVIFGNGYNDTGSGEAKLFILYLEEGLDGTWSPTDYVKISTGVGDTTTRNGLSTPAVIDTDGDGVADRAYAGDLFGNMWAFDLSSTNPGNWGVAYRAGTTPRPLFVAGSSKPITAAPVIVKNPDV